MERLLASVLAIVLAACSGGSTPTDGGNSVDAGPDTDGPAADASLDTNLLSSTGLYTDIANKTLASGVIPYGVRYALWSDGAEKTRYLLLPPGTQIDTSDMNWWVFPNGTRFFKQFVRDGVLVETRMLEKRSDGSWNMIAFVWNDDESDAVATMDPVLNARGTGHDVPSPAQCMQCHAAGDNIIGVSAFLFTTEGASNHLEALASRMTNPSTQNFAPPGSGNTQAVLGYLHANCGGCHNAQHSIAFITSLRLKLLTTDTTVESTGLYTTAVDQEANMTLLGTDQIVDSGNPDHSLLYLRMGDRSGDAMPPLGTELVDTEARAMVSTWITSLP